MASECSSIFTYQHHNRSAEVILKAGDSMEFETERLRMRPIEESDAAAIYPLINDKEISDNMLNIPYPYPEENLVPWIGACREGMENCERYELVMILKETGELMGVCSLLHIDWENKHAEVSYWLGKKYWNKGYTTEAVKQLICMVFREYGLEYIYGCCFARNPASARVMKKAGMRYMTHTRYGVKKGGEDIDVICFDMSLREFLARG